MIEGKGKIILLNGASSSGKSTLSRGLMAALPEPFWHYSIDHLRDSGILPMARVKSGDFKWSEMRTGFFEGFHRSLPAFAGAGNNLIVEHIVETVEWRERLIDLLEGFDVFVVGVHCPLEELERRERARGDRPIGDARRDFEMIHELCVYDMEVDMTADLEENVGLVVSEWLRRLDVLGIERIRPGAWER